jgi:hypothetical protein
LSVAFPPELPLDPAELELPHAATASAAATATSAVMSNRFLILLYSSPR